MSGRDYHIRQCILSGEGGLCSERAHRKALGLWQCSVSGPVNKPLLCEQFRTCFTFYKKTVKKQRYAGLASCRICLGTKGTEVDIVRQLRCVYVRGKSSPRVPLMLFPERPELSAC